MHCPKCGAEVTEQSVYCHRCGERVDVPQEEAYGEDRPAAKSAPGDTPSGNQPDGPPQQSPPSAAERFRERVAVEPPEWDEPEEDLWQGRYSSKAMLRAWVLGGLITVALIVLAAWISRSWATWSAVILILLLWLCQLAVMKYRQWNVRYRLTNQRFLHETGILRRTTDRIEVIDIDDIAFEQRLLERLVGVGTIRVSSSDRTHPELLLRGIDNVREVSEKIDNIRRAERRRRGLHFESI
jgi:membrane protein YdbS with pleckstrin-like domain